MAIKVSSIEVISDGRVLSGGSLTMTGDYGPDVHPIQSNISGSSVSLNIESNSQIFLSLTGNGVIALSDSQRGCLSEIIMTTNGFSPVFSGVDFFWSGDTEPAWGDHDIWRISCVGTSSSGNCAASAVGYDAAGTFIPTSGAGVTATGREIEDGYLMFLNSTCTSFTEVPYAEYDGRLRLSRNSGFRVEIEGQQPLCSGASPVQWHNGTSYSNLGTSLTTVYTNTSVTPTALKLVVNRTGFAQGFAGSSETGAYTYGSYTLGNWSAVTGDGQFVEVEFTMYAGGAAQAYNYAQADWEIEVWGRGAGFDDTLLATYSFRGIVEAEYLNNN